MQGRAASPNREFWNGRRVLVVGNTGFKGSWLSLWLHRLGGKVAGLALPPPTKPSLSALAGLADMIPTSRVDIRDLRRCVPPSGNYSPTSCSTWRHSRWCGRHIASLSRPMRPMSWEPSTFWRPCARCRVSVAQS